jgi:hypothetical protein
MLAPIRLSMFQCMLAVDADTSIKTIWHNLCRSPDKRIMSKFASPPGSLRRHLTTQEITTHQIGSISLKLRYMNINLSVLIFSTLKIKISGGLQQLEFDDLTTTSFWEFIDLTVLTPCVGIVCSESNGFSMTNGMVNANIRRNAQMQFTSYLKIVDDIVRKAANTHVVHPPPCLLDATVRGRRCATKYKRIDGKGSLMFDHSGNIQAFAYRNLEDLVADVNYVCSMMS